MAKYTGPKCKLCRRESTKLFLKGTRCFTAKCGIELRNFAPGQHGQQRTKLSEYGQQLREKQKLRRIYGILERQFKFYFVKAQRQKGVTGEKLLQLLETRLDSVVLSLGFASARPQARQLIRHGHIKVNRRKVNIPAYNVKAGDVIEVKDAEHTKKRIRENIEASASREIPVWLRVNKEALKGEVVSVPTRADIKVQVNEQLIVELYSK
ncbi:MAG TPA: 30S ribosomal protein S4 [bacterium]|nr:30S ribosomal protein S4 [bacterium]